MSANREHIVDAIKASPIVGGFVIWLAGIDLQTWLVIASLVYAVLVAVDKVCSFIFGCTVRELVIRVLKRPKVEPSA